MPKTIAIPTKQEIIDECNLTNEERELVELGRKQTERAYPPASLYFVGAAASYVKDGVRKILLGQNVEAANFRNTVCSEGAIAALINTDEVDPKTINTLYCVGRIGIEGFQYPAEGFPPAPPCGACRTDINYLNPDMTVLSSAWVGKYSRITQAKGLLPFSIDPNAIALDPMELAPQESFVQGTLLEPNELSGKNSGHGYDLVKAYDATKKHMEHLRKSGVHPREVAAALLDNGDMVFGVEGEQAPPSQPRYGAEVKALWNTRRMGVDHRIKTLFRIRAGSSKKEIPHACNGPVAQIMVEFADKLPDGMQIVYGHEEGSLLRVSGVDQILPDAFKFNDFVPAETMKRFQ